MDIIEQVSLAMADEIFAMACEGDARVDIMTGDDVRRLARVAVSAITEKPKRRSLVDRLNDPNIGGRLGLIGAEAADRIENLEDAINHALQCTPQLWVEHGNFAQPVHSIRYDCGDPWEILRDALNYRRYRNSDNGSLKDSEIAK